MKIRLTTTIARTAPTRTALAIIKSLVIVENGCGMHEKGLDDALTLSIPSPEDGITDAGCLSDFGMGLKSVCGLH